MGNKDRKFPIPKAGRGHSIGDIIQVHNHFLKLSKQYLGDCKDECDLFKTDMCTKVACQKSDRIDRQDVIYKLVLLYDQDF